MYRSPDGDPAGGASVDLTVFDEFFSDNPAPAADEKPAKKPEEEDTAGKGDEKPDAKSAGDEKPDAGEEGDQKPAGEEGGDPAGEEEDFLPEINVEETEPEGTWIDVAETLGIEKPEKPDDFEGFKTNYEKKLVSEYERGKAEATSADLSKFSPDARLFFDSLNGGLKPAELINVAAPYNEVLAQPNDELFKMYLTETLKLTEEKADEQIALLQENGTFDVESAKIRALVTQNRDTKVNEMIANSAKAWEGEQKRIVDERNAFNTQVKSALDAKTEFLGGKLSDSHRKSLMQLWESGTFESSLKKNPAAIVDFMLYQTFGKDRLGKMKETISSQTKLEQIKRQSNTPDTGAGGAAAASKARQNAGAEENNTLAVLKEAFPD